MSAAAGTGRRLSLSPELPPVKKQRLGDGGRTPFGLKPVPGATTNKSHSKRKGKGREQPPIEPCSPEDVLWHDIQALLGTRIDTSPPFEKQDIVELEITALSSDGRGLALTEPAESPWVVIVPFSLPGERVKAKIWRHEFSKNYSFADFIEVLRPNETLRDNSRIQCRYFSQCGGCQYQMLSYSTQLDFKREVIVKAYKNFSNLPSSSIPLIQPTIGSPLEYRYRTKITPHFQAPPKSFKPSSSDNPDEKPDWLKIGFNWAGQNRVLDVEECPIATPAINDALPGLRKGIIDNIHTYKKGATLLLRDSLVVSSSDPPPPALQHVCVTDPHGTIHTRIGDFIFEYGASSFFQNNDSVLPLLTDYVKSSIFAPWSTSASTSSLPRPTHLIDAYCGSGLFSICLSPYFDTIAGIELSRESIKAAKNNAELNKIGTEKLSFREGEAEGIFDVIRREKVGPERGFPRDETTIIIDPPRKGCSASFISQLVDFRASTVVYVSCNVHTQARDIGLILSAELKADEDNGTKPRYVLESLCGFDLFPQTAHVESVAVLRLVYS